MENKVKMKAWEKIFGNGSKIFPDKVFTAIANDTRFSSVGPDFVQLTKEKLVAALGNSNTCGIGLYQASSSTGTTFIKIN